MSFPIVQNPQILPSPQTIQKPQNSSYSKHALRLATCTLATSAIIGNAIAINCLMKETPTLFSIIFNERTLTSVLETAATSAVGCIGGGLLSGAIAKCVTPLLCQPGANSDIITGIYYGTPIVSACFGAMFGAVALPAARLLPI